MSDLPYGCSACQGHGYQNGASGDASCPQCNGTGCWPAPPTDWQSRALAAEAQLARQGEVLKLANGLLLSASIHLEEWPGDDDESQRTKAARIAAAADAAATVVRSTLSPEDSHG